MAKNIVSLLLKLINLIRYDSMRTCLVRLCRHAYLFSPLCRYAYLFSPPYVLSWSAVLLRVLF